MLRLLTCAIFFARSSKRKVEGFRVFVPLDFQEIFVFLRFLIRMYSFIKFLESAAVQGAL